MNIILLSGGSGKRLLPLSNDIRSKQFIKFFKNSDGTYESMVQKVYKQIKKADKNALITIATSKQQVSSIRNQLGSDVSICVEPCRKDTFPAVVLSALFLKDELKIDLNEPVIVCPVDPYVDDEYFESLKDLSDLVKNSKSNLCLLGVTPTYPSEKYGYIVPTTNDKVSCVSSFKEKPSKEMAKKLIEKGALWNGGIFGFILGYLINKSIEIFNCSFYKDLLSQYNNLPKISFDYAIVEKECNIQVMRYNGHWADLGTWNTLTEAIDDKIIGKGITDVSSTGVHIINELDLPILAMGLHDVIISASPDGILVSDKEHSSYIKKYVENLGAQVRYAEKSWGSFTVIDVDRGYLTMKVTLLPGHKMNYHSHKHRDEVWAVLSGTGKTIIEGIENTIRSGDTIFIKSGQKHTVIATTELKMIEIQLGKDIKFEDKEKFDLTLC